MTKYRVVPEELPDAMLDAIKIDHPIGEGETGKLLRRLNKEQWKTLLSAVPPLPADIERALARAKELAAHYDKLRLVYPDSFGKHETSEEIVSRALLKVTGRE